MERGIIAELRKRSQVTIPKEIVDRMSLQEGDRLEFVIKDGYIIVVPVVTIPKSQRWYWTKGWQQAEKEADEEIRAGRVTPAMTADEMIKYLHSEQADETQSP